MWGLYWFGSNQFLHGRSVPDNVVELDGDAGCLRPGMGLLQFVSLSITFLGLHGELSETE